MEPQSGTDRCSEKLSTRSTAFPGPSATRIRTGVPAGQYPCSTAGNGLPDLALKRTAERKKGVGEPEENVKAFFKNHRLG